MIRTVLAAFLLLSQSVSATTDLVLTGIVSSAKQQVVSAPKTRSWQVQVQWLAEEGAQVKAGDLIAVFDSSSYETQIKTNQDRLSSLELELKQAKTDLSQKVIEAQGALDAANIQVELAAVEASITSDEVSKYDKGKYQLEMERALFNRIKAKESLKQAEQNKQTEITKKQIDIKKLKQEIQFQSEMMEKVKVKAEMDGVVSHMLHPWNGNKITAGAMVQPSMKVLTVDSLSDYEITAWVHERDVLMMRDVKNANIVLDAFPQHKLDGEVTLLSSQTEKREQWSQSAYHQVKMKFEPSASIKLLPGMSARVEVMQGASDE